MYSRKIRFKVGEIEYFVSFECEDTELLDELVRGQIVGVRTVAELMREEFVCEEQTEDVN